MSHKIVVKSITYANKAKYILNTNYIDAEIQKITDISGSCRYEIVLAPETDIVYARKLLLAAGVKILYEHSGA